MRIALLGDFDTFLFRGLERPLSHGQYRLSPALNLARGFRELGVKDIHYVVVTPEVRQPTSDDGPFGRLHRVPRPKFSGSTSLFLWRRRLILRELERIQPDIVHGHGTEGEYAFTAVTSPYRHVVTLHGLMHRVHGVTPPPLLSLEHAPRWIEKIVVKKARNAICISAAVESFLKERRSPARCYRVPNAVAPCFFETKNQRRAAGEPTLLFVGSIYPLKGLLQLVEAMALVESTLGRNVRLQVIGPSSGGRKATGYEAAVRKRAEELGVGERIEWRGVQHEHAIASALAQADALALPSFQESAPMCVAEAMAAGVPVVSSRVGGIPEMLDEGNCGLLVSPGRPEELAEALCRCFTDATLREKIVAAARAQAAAQYQPRIVAEQTLAVYETIVRETHRRNAA